MSTEPILFDVVLTDNADAKIAFNKIIETIPYWSADIWANAITWLNGNAVDGGTMPAKQCYKVGLIFNLIEFANETDIRFAKKDDKKYVYTGKYWAIVEDDLLKTFLRNLALKNGIPESLAREERFIKGLLAQFESQGFYEPIVNTQVSYLNLQNCTLKVTREGVEELEHNPKLFLNYILDYEYDPKAKNDKWIEFIDRVLPDKDTQKTLQQSLGYLFSKDLKLEKAFFLYGTGSNGKSVVFEVIDGLLDKEMITNNSLEQLTEDLPYFRYQLDGKLINYASDVSLKKVKAATLKMIASGEPITVRQIQGKSYIMRDYAKLIFNLNKIDDAAIEHSFGFFRRMVFIPFNVTIPPEEQDVSLHHEILENKSGVLNWILEGLKEVQTNKRLFISDECNNFLDNWKNDSSPIITFLNENGIEARTQEENKTVSFVDMFSKYKSFCKKWNEKAMRKIEFNAELKLYGFERTRRNRGNVWFAEIVDNRPSSQESQSSIVDFDKVWGKNKKTTP